MVSRGRLYMWEIFGFGSPLALQGTTSERRGAKHCYSHFPSRLVLSMDAAADSARIPPQPLLQCQSPSPCHSNLVLATSVRSFCYFSMENYLQL